MAERGIYMRWGKLRPRSLKSSSYHSHCLRSRPASAHWSVPGVLSSRRQQALLYTTVFKDVRGAPAGRFLPRGVCTPKWNASASGPGKDYRCLHSSSLFSSTGPYRKKTMSMPRSNPRTWWLEMQRPRFGPVLFPKVKGELNTKHANNHAVEQVPANTTGIPGISWMGGEALENSQTQTSCFPFVTLGMQNQVNKKLRWKSTQLTLLIWPRLLPHLHQATSCLHFATSLL